MSSTIEEFHLEKPLYKYCKNATNREGDTFVGIKSELIDEKHSLTVYFPLGYKISQDDELVRNEIIQLLSVLQDYNDEQSQVASISPEQLLKTVRFPAQAYIRVISDYINNGYYKMSENEFRLGTSGPISWNRTRNQIEPIVTKNGFVFPHYVVRQHNETDKQLITEISKYCVFESYVKIGWLYGMPHVHKPQMTKELSVYKSYLNGMKERATKDRDKQLFSAMLDILNFTNQQDEPEEFYFGTNKFEYIWERLIEATFGNENKEYYFPRTKWLLHIGSKKTNNAIEPDTVMKQNNDIYVLDAKYYKYGVTLNPNHLPESTSINKQISYGEYIRTNAKFEDERKQGMSIYNAFLMPYDSKSKPFNDIDSKYFSIGEAVAEWKNSTEPYERVQGILVDVKHLISNVVRPNNNEIANLSETILESLRKKQES
ncbi:LlaJI family restriction endonuclease [Streptococcus suis]|uniref:Type II restriction-modification system restriction subunit n=2 Tax=Streptococcus TaxID=1301 RepID=A0A123TYK7_STRSU|nr:LlaJI family restriction endonuclease [Streptococcus suis]MBY4980802.1 LlaJI family restriction endonuclease [Streptococcus suis]MBY4991339.1 LlaJI family restriction endonuclease [Streptococcus suis]MBY5006910.1 LlaJI family restriction endonuclease [Streptococcus suis]MCK3870796.1 LlaJI family restriction endonuclease [Streptococcus suis]NQG75389.1 LlaJI family restriction endonuclease [Streptococcus suis]